MTEAKNWKKLLAYAGLLPLSVALLVLRWHNMEPLALLQSEILLVIGYIASLRDIREKKVANQTVLALLVCWLLTFFPQLVLDLDRALPRLISATLGGLFAGLLFLLVYLMSRGGLGGGDVKFMAVAGLYLGANGVLPAMLYGSALAAVFGLSLLLFKKIQRKDTIPLIPFLYLGILLTLFFF